MNIMLAYDLHVHSTFSGGESTLEQLVSTAKFLGYNGIGFVTYPLRKEEENILKAEIERISKKENFKIFFGVEVTTSSELRKFVRRRKEIDLLLVRGGSVRMNRLGVETPEVDILTHPSYERKDCGINHIIARFARKNEVAIEINFREVLLSRGVKRAQVIKNHMEIVRIAKKYKAPILISSGALSHWELRDPHVLISYGVKIGMTLKEAKEAVGKTPLKIIDRVMRKKKEIMPGVMVVK